MYEKTPITDKCYTLNHCLRRIMMTKIPSYEKHRIREFEQQCIMLKELFILLKKKISSDTRHLFDKISIQTKTGSNAYLDISASQGFGEKNNQVDTLKEITQNMLDAQEIHEELKRLSTRKKFQNF